MCRAATTPNEFLITGYFNIHVDDPYDSQASSFLTLLSDASLVQHVNFPTQDSSGHTLDFFVITSVDSNLNPEVVRADSQPSDHYPVFSHLSISPDPLPPPQTRTFRQLHSTDHTTLLNDLKQTSLVPESLSHLVDLYDSTLSNLLDKHAPIVTKRSARVTPSQPWFTDSLRTARRECRHVESACRSTRSYFDYAVYKTLCNRYHKLVVATKKAYYFFLVADSAGNRRRQWDIIASCIATHPLYYLHRYPYLL